MKKHLTLYVVLTALAVVVSTFSYFWYRSEVDIIDEETSIQEALAQSRAPQAGNLSEQQIANHTYNATEGATQAYVVGRGVTSPQANDLSMQRIANYTYNATEGALQIYLSSNSSDIPFINTTSLTDGDLLYYDTAGSEWLNTQGQITTSGIGTSPQITFKNPTAEDTDGGRESTIRFRGIQSGGEESTLGTFQMSHDATSDNQRGQAAICVNDSNDGENPSKCWTFLAPTTNTGELEVGIASYISSGGTENLYFSFLRTELYKYLNTADTATIRYGSDSDFSTGYNSADDTYRLADGDDITTTPLIIADTNTVTVAVGQKIKRTDAGAADYNPSALTSDYLIVADNSAAARAITISTEDVQSGSTANPRIFLIKDEYGNATAQNLTVSLESGNIDGAASQVISADYGAIQFYCDGTNCFLY